MKMFAIKIGKKYFQGLKPNKNYVSSGVAGTHSQFYLRHSYCKFSPILSETEKYFDYRTLRGYFESVTECIHWGELKVNKIEVIVKNG